MRAPPLSSGGRQARGALVLELRLEATARFGTTPAVYVEKPDLYICSPLLKRTCNKRGLRWRIEALDRRGRRTSRPAHDFSGSPTMDRETVPIRSTMTQRPTTVVAQPGACLGADGTIGSAARLRTVRRK
jgi:hypothetical protein